VDRDTPVSRTPTHALAADLDRNLKKCIARRKARRDRCPGANTLLQLRDVEDGVYLARRRKCEAVGNLAHPFKHLQRPEELVRQLVVQAPFHRLLYVGLERQEDFCPHLERALRVVFVGLVLHTLLHTKEMLSHGLKHQRALPQPVLHISWSNGISSCNTKIPGLATIKKIEGRFSQ
jgi:hypothetical protein